MEGIEKQRLSYSRIRHYLTCPKRLELMKLHEATMSASTKKAMQDGRVFESFVFGDKDGFLGKLPEKTIKSESYKRVVSDAENFTANFPTDLKSSGESYIRYEIEFEDFVFSGEIDYLGDITYINDDGELVTERAIVDLKYTGNIDFVWKPFQYKEDILQVLVYSWMHYEKTGEQLDAFYLVVEGGKMDNPVYALKKVIIDPSEYDFVKNLIFNVAYDFGRLPKCSAYTCIGGRGVGRCPWLEFCGEGRALLGGYEIIESAILPSKSTKTVCNQNEVPEEDPEEIES